jgi:ribosomal-protein-alanine N-acetyltransferase
MSAPLQTSGEVTLELARLSDAGAIAAMSRALVESGLPWTWTAQRVGREIRDRNTNVLVARGANGIAGFAIMRFGETHAHLNLLCVDPRYRRRGLGKRMMEWLEETARVAGVEEIGLEVRKRNTGARLFYQALGYQEAGVLHGYYSGIEAAVGMKRALRGGQPLPPGSSDPIRHLMR